MFTSTRLRLQGILTVLGLSALLTGPAWAQVADVGTLPGGNICDDVWLINNQGAVAGRCRDAGGDFVAVHRPAGAGAPVPLPTLEVGRSCRVADLNDDGVMAGNCEHGDAGEWGPVRWQSAGLPQALQPPFGHVEAAAVAVNAHGVVIGVSTDSDGTTQGVIWLAGATAATSLPGLGLLDLLTTECDVSAVNDAAPRPAVAGLCGLDSGGVVAIRWTPTGLLGTYEATELNRLPSGRNCIVSAINTAGRVAGTCEASDGDIHAASWEPGDADPTFLDEVQNLAVAMNEAGVIAGNYLTSDGFVRAFRWEPGMGNPAEDVGSLGGFWTEATDLADDGTVTGAGQTATGVTHAFASSPGAAIVDLGTLGGFTSVADTISSNGCIAGTSQTADGHTHAFVTATGTCSNLQLRGELRAGSDTIPTTYPGPVRSPIERSSGARVSSGRGSIVTINAPEASVQNSTTTAHTGGVPAARLGLSASRMAKASIIGAGAGLVALASYHGITIRR